MFLWRRIREYITQRKEAKMEEKMTRCYKNRELSWLAFNERVLDEAANPKVPLAERLTFASIFQSNLDEFFMVRVGTLMVQMQSKERIFDNKTGLSSEEQVDAILKEVKKLEKKKAVVYEQLMGELEPHGVRLIKFGKLSIEEGKLLEQYFDAHVAPFLSPMIIGKQQPFPFLTNKQLYAVVMLRTQKGKDKIGIVPCSNGVFKRLIEIPTRPGYFMLSEELILHFVSKLYEKYEIREKAILRVTRNADIEASDVYDEDLDYRDMMEYLIKRRNRLSPVRIELSRELGNETISELAKYLEVKKKNFICVDTPLDLSFVFQLQCYLENKKELFYEKRIPRPYPLLDLNKSILAQIEEKDVLLSYPFESMKPFIKMLEEAATDSSVVSIKMTLYRVADRSKIIDALVEAAENGKEVVVLVELRARFDEANNIEMSKRLEEAGCHILFGLGEYKVHSKLCLITRAVNDEYSYITQIGTGNYNEKTARMYTDLSLITARQSIGEDAAKVFAALQKGEIVDEIKELMVAPHCLQNRILEMIDEQIIQAQSGKPAYVGAKVNALTDKAIIDKLIEASQAGVKIQLIVRGICCLVPGISGLTDNITVVSVVGRYLEHSRIYRFGVGEDEKVYISSADFMTRNTLRRVEVAVPILDASLKEQVIDIFGTIFSDNVKGREMDEFGVYRTRSTERILMNSQEEFFQRAYAAVDDEI